MSLKALISDDYRKLNRQLHETNVSYGTSGHAYADAVAKIAELYKAESILDYGCGKGTFKKSLPSLNIKEYDPCIPGKDSIPEPADIVMCNDVLEHIEPELLESVIKDLSRVTKKLGFFVIDLFPASKFLSDGRNAHLIQETDTFWRYQIEKYLEVVTVSSESLRKLIFIVRPK